MAGAACAVPLLEHEDHLLLNTCLALLIIVLKLGSPVFNNIQVVLSYFLYISTFSSIK